MKHFLIYLLLFMPISLLSQDFKIAGGTSTITLVTPDTVWMAADSKQSFGRIDSMKPSGYHNKILQADSFFYMIAGIPIIKNEINQTAIDFDDIMRSAILETKNIDSVVNKFKKESINKLSFLLQFVAPLFINIRKAQNHPVLVSISITTCVNNQLETRNFNIEFIENGDYIGFKPVDTTYKSSTYLHPMGYAEEVGKIRNMPGFSLDPNKIKESLVYMINLEADAHSEYVGGTVDVIKIYKGGFEWLTNNTY